MVAFLTTAVPGVAVALSEWTLHRTDDGGHPNGREQALLWLMNRARQDPSAEGRWLARSKNIAIAGGREAYRIDRSMLIKEFDAIEPAPPAAFDARLYTAAIKHAKNQIARDVQDHKGQLKRVTRTGVDWKSCRGNVFSYASGALNTHAAFNIDWGVGPGGMQPTRGHRKAIMASDRPYTNVGLAAVPERNARSAVGELVVVGNYCSYFANSDGEDFNRFVVGTVWSDRNGNGIYNAGEGVSGVSVIPSTGSYYAVTSRGGGYAFPVRGNIEFELSFSGASVPGRYKNVRVGRHSELVDYQINADADDGTNAAGEGDLLDGPVLQMTTGERYPGRHGWKFGSSAHRHQVVFNFEHDGTADYELNVTGFHINSHKDVDVYVNNNRIARLNPVSARDDARSEARSDDGGTTNSIVISNRLLSPGTNSLRFVKRRPGQRWGVGRVQLTDRSGPAVSLLQGSSASEFYGFGDAVENARYPVALHVNFRGADADLKLFGSVRDIDFDGEVWVYLNGQRLNTLPVTDENVASDFSVNLPLRHQLAGNNDLEFRLNRAGSDWAVGNLVLR